MIEKNKYILLGLGEFLLLIIGLLVLNYLDTILAFIMAPFFIAIVLIDFKLLSMVLKKIERQNKFNSGICPDCGKRLCGKHVMGEGWTYSPCPCMNVEMDEESLKIIKKAVGTK